MTDSPDLPLAGLLVLDMSLFLAGPFAALRLQDLGARVIKVERPDGGDPSRGLYKEDDEIDSLLFHIINRGKESIALNLKDETDRAVLFKLIDKADVLIQNYRPGVAERLGFGYDEMKKRNPGLVYAAISGYGAEGPWVGLPGQDLLAQARSGIMWLSGNEGDAPTPTGLALADVSTGVTAAQGILAALVGRARSGKGALIETNLLDTLLDLQFEQLAMYMNKGQLPRRSSQSNANAYAPAPYGVYETADGYLAIAMTPMDRLADLIGCPALKEIDQSANDVTLNRDEMKATLGARLIGKSTQYWLDILQPADIWCAEVMDWEALLASEQGQIIDMVQEIARDEGGTMKTARIPMRLNGARMGSTRPGPALGAHSHAIRAELVGS